LPVNACAKIRTNVAQVRSSTLKPATATPASNTYAQISENAGMQKNANVFVDGISALTQTTSWTNPAVNANAKSRKSVNLVST
jgi:hypothetical protein